MRHLLRFSLWAILVCSGFSLTTDDAAAGTPKLAKILPPAGQRGTTATVYLTGRYLELPKEVLLYEPGITVESVEPSEGPIDYNGTKINAEVGTRVKVKLKIAYECPLGAHGLRLRTSTGLTEYHRFFVSPYPVVEEEETTLKRNDKRENAKVITANSTVIGRIQEATDTDLYRLDVKKGQRVSAEIEAARIGVDRGIPDLHLAILDEEGKKLAAADDSALFVQDPVLSIVAPRDGAYFVEVRHCMFNGANEAYNLHVGTFTRPTGIYPAGGPVGAELKVQILGDPRGLWNQTVRLPATPADFAFTAIDPDTNVPSSSPNRLRVSPFPNVLETEPNDSAEAMTNAPIADLPAAFNGIISKPGDVDCFRFKAKKGEQFKFHALAKALGSPVDPMIWIKQVGGKVNAAPLRAADARPNQLGNPPAGGLNRDMLDAILEFTVPADGEYVLGIEDERGEGGSDYVYRIEAQPEQNAVYTYIAPEPENQNAPQLRQSIVIPAGNRFTAQIAIFNTNKPFNGELEIVALNLPKGVTMHAPKLTTGMTKVPVVFEASADAEAAGALIDLQVRPVSSSETLISGYRQVIMMNQYGNNDYYLHATIDKLALAVAETSPFIVRVVEPKSALVQNGEMSLKFTVEREKGYDGPVTVQMDWKPTGISTATPVTVPAGKSEGVYLLGASRNATAGNHQVALTAMSGTGRKGYSDGTDRTYTASQPFKLTVAEPHVEAKIARTSIERGKTTTLVCKLTHLQAFEGKAQATLARLPRGVELVEPMKEITSADKEVSFSLRATPEALLGNFQGIVLDLTVIDNGQAVRQLSGAGLLRVDAERGVQPKSK